MARQLHMNAVIESAEECQVYLVRDVRCSSEHNLVAIVM